MNQVLKAKSDDVFTIVEHLFNNGSTAWIVVSGMSMYPFLREDLDKVELAKADIAGIKKGDIVLIKRKSGEYVLHRVIKKKNSEFYIMGDAQQWLEGPVPGDQLIAVAINISRGNKFFSCKNRLYKSLSLLWMMIVPIRYKAIKLFKIMFGAIPK